VLALPHVGECLRSRGPALVVLSEDARGRRQGLQHRPIDLVEQLPARHVEPADWALVIEPVQYRADRCELGEAVENAVAQASDWPALDQPPARPWPCRSPNSGCP